MKMRHIPDEVRQGFARVYGCGEDEVSDARGTSDGIDCALWGVDWREGDELVTTNMERIGGLGAAYVLSEQFRVKVHFASFHGADDALAAVQAQMSPKTKVIAISHVLWPNGAVLPLAEISELAHRQGALVIVDGAQVTVGAVPLDVKALGVDAYAGPGQKWLCGPGGTGGLYVSRDALDRMRSSFAAYRDVRQLR